MSTELLSSLIESIVSEKRAQFRARPGLDIIAVIGPEAYGLFGKLNAGQFKRVLSNLINNSVEAISANTGRVEITLVSEGDHGAIFVKDSGKGIPMDVVPKLPGKGFSYDKAGGSGLGLFSAKEIVESWGGTLTISSEYGRWTSVIIRLRLAKPPLWYVPVLLIPPRGIVAVLDDDQSVHHVWNKRFVDPVFSDASITLMDFSTAGEFEKWFEADGGATTNYLIDYELLKQDKTGLDVISDLGISDRSVLVTSWYEDQAILKRCEKLGVRIIPKSLAPIVPIRVDAALTSDDTNFVLIDDSHLVRISWEACARKSGHRLTTFASPAEFLATITQFNTKNTTVYIDSDLGLAEPGEQTARKLAELGYEDIYVTTGHPKEKFKDFWWLKGSMGKTSPWAETAPLSYDVIPRKIIPN